MTVPSLLAVVTTDEGAKLLVFVAAVIALLWLGKWSSRLGGNSNGSSTNDMPGVEEKEFADPKSQPDPFAPGADEIAASFPHDPSLGTIRMKKFIFEKINPYQAHRTATYLPMSFTSSSTIRTQVMCGGSLILLRRLRDFLKSFEKKRGNICTLRRFLCSRDTIWKKFVEPQ